MSSSDRSLGESDVIEIECKVLYASEWWTPVIHCLPEIPSEVDSNYVSSLNSSNAMVTYSKTITVTSRLDNVKFDCHATFNSTSNSSSSNVGAPASIHLWTSPAIKVKRKYSLSFVDTFSLIIQHSF